MIVKNEEKVLARCLESVKSVVDEIIIVDTGSSDTTKEIAARFTDKIYDFEWCDDFSAARNFAFSKAGCDYIMWLDADDILLKNDREKLCLLMQDSDGSADVIMLPYHTAFDENGAPLFSFYRERIVKRSKGFTWKGRVHEAIEYGGNVIYSDAAVTHRSVKKQYSTRNLDIYLKQESLGEPFTPRDQFYFGRELYYHGHYERAAEVLNNFLDENKGWLENNIEACKILSFCYTQTGNSKEAFHALCRSFIYDSPRAEICCEIGNLLMRENRYAQAKFWFATALGMQPDAISGAFVSADCYGYIPAIQLAVCFDRTGDVETARKYNELAGAIKPDSAAYQHNKAYFDSLSGNA